MSGIFDDRKKALEEEYFRKKEQELIEKLKQRARVEADREGLAEATGTTNEQILEAFREMGLDRETVCSSTSSAPRGGVERRVGVGEGARGHPRDGRGARDHGRVAGRTGSCSVAREPARPRALRAGENSDARPPGLHDRRTSARSRRGTSLRQCEEIAAASGGILGLGSRTSAAEREVLQRVVAEIQKTDQAAARSAARSLERSWVNRRGRSPRMGAPGRHRLDVDCTSSHLRNPAPNVFAAITQANLRKLKENPMFFSRFLILFMALFVVWVLGGFVFHVAGGLIHILLVVAVISLIVHFVRGRP